MVITIDGPAGAGKSTVARGVAAALGLTYLDSGAMYRAVALAASRAGVDPDDGAALGELARGLEIGLDGPRVLLGGEDVGEAIRTPEVTALASRVSVHPSVREALVVRQRELIAGADYVAEGRDIGTVVSPDAPLKVYLGASDAERARRRAAETGEPAPAVLAAQAERDSRDRDRAHGALRAATDAIEIDTTDLAADEVVARVVALARERGLAGRTVARPLRIAVVGFPNVGKSTLVNRLAGGREAVVHKQAGVTRDRKAIECEWNGLRFELIDTGGVDLAAADSLSRPVQDQAREAIADAEVVALVLDARAGLRQGDAEVAQILRRSDATVLVVANKVDSDNEEPLVGELYALGLGEPIPVSATQGRGTGDLLDRLVESLRQRVPAAPESPSPGPAADPSAPGRTRAELGSPVADAPWEEADGIGSPVAIAVIGRPNVGKSSLVNALLGDRRVIVSELAGTTRDAIDTPLELDGRELTLIDTAGLRRRTKVAGTVDYYAQIRSERAAARADVAIVVCDGSEGVTAEDMRVAELAMKSGCATLVALNKWDLRKPARRSHRASDPDAPGREAEEASGSAFDLADASARLGRRMRQRPPLIATSAKTGRAVPKLLERAIELADRRAERIPTPELNRFLADVVALRSPPQKRGKRLRLYYAAQVGRRPPRIAIQVNDRGLISRDWAYYLENRLRERYGLEGVPLVIDYVPHSRRARDH